MYIKIGASHPGSPFCVHPIMIENFMLQQEPYLCILQRDSRDAD